MPKQILSLKSKFNDFLQTYIIFLMTRLFVIFIKEDIFLQEYMEMELKTFFIIFEECFKWEKQNIAIITFKQASITHRYIILLS